MKTGTYVSRSVYAKLQNEHRKLKDDIWKMVMGDIATIVFTKAKYRKEFEREDMFVAALKEAARKHFKSEKK